jgi:pyruvate kinase
MKKTKIIITISPGINRLSILKEMKKAGADIVRVNTKYIKVKDYDKIKKNCQRLKFKVMVGIKKRTILRELTEKEFDYLAVSFAENPGEIEKIRKMFKRKIKIISKIETKKGVRNIEKLIKVSDGIMIARGDLGEQMSFEKVPMIQKLITKKCNKKKKMSITATEMLHSMVCRKRPTRAEASDVVNAILEGSEALLLAEETAIGKYPVLSVKVMNKLIKETESHIRELKNK